MAVTALMLVPSRARLARHLIPLLPSVTVRAAQHRIIPAASAAPADAAQALRHRHLVLIPQAEEEAIAAGVPVAEALLIHRVLAALRVPLHPRVPLVHQALPVHLAHPAADDHTNQLTGIDSRTVALFCTAMPLETVYLSLGSNLGDRAENLRAAIAALADVNVRRVSSFYETEPVDYLNQPWFLNCVVEAETSLAPLDLLHALRNIESQLGSKKEFAKGPRLLDLDILLYGNETIDLPELQIPHPRMLQRNFVLAPLAEIAPSLKHSTWQANVADLFQASTDKSRIRKV